MQQLPAIAGVFACLVGGNAMADEGPPTHERVKMLLDRAERCEAGEQFAEEAKLLAACRGQPGEEETHELLAGLLEATLQSCAVPDQIPEAMTPSDVLDLLETAAQRSSDTFVDSLAALLRKQVRTSTSPAALALVVARVRTSFNRWLAEHPDVKFGVEQTRTRVVVTRGQSQAIFERTRAAIAKHPELSKWYPWYLAKIETELDRLIAVAEKAGYRDVVGYGHDPFFVLLDERTFPERDFIERRAAYLKNLRRFRGEVPDYLVAMIAASFGFENEAVIRRLLRAEIPQFKLAFRIPSHVGNILGTTERRSRVDGGVIFAERPVVRIDIDDAAAYGWFADATVHELTHAILQSDRAAIERMSGGLFFSREDVSTREAFNEWILEGFTEALTQRTRELLAAFHNEERRRRTGAEAGVFTYEPLVGIVTYVARSVGDARATAWYVGGAPTAEFRAEVDTALTDIGMEERDRRETVATIFADDTDYDAMTETYFRVILALERRNRSLHIEARELPFTGDVVANAIAAVAPLTRDERITLDRATRLYERSRVVGGLPADTLIRVAEYLTRQPKDRLDAKVFGGKSGTTIASELYRAAQRVAPDDAGLIATIVLADPEAVSRTPNSFVTSELTRLTDAATRDPGNMRLRLARAVVAFQGWDERNRNHGILVAEELGVVIAHGKPADLEAAIGIMDRMRRALGSDRVLPPPDPNTFLGLFVVSTDDAIDVLADRLLDPLEDAGVIPSASDVESKWRADRYFDPSDVLSFLGETAQARLPKDAR